MKVIDILNESKKRENYIIILYKNKYKVMNKKNEIIGRKLGYEDLESALDSVLQITSKAYSLGNFYKKKKIINKEIIKWKKRNNFIEKKPRKKHGFYEQ